MGKGMHRAVTLVMGLAAASTAFACGDRLAALGGGVRFERVFYSRHPGNVVVYAPAASALRTATERYGMLDALRRAGHEVRAADDAAALERALAGAPPDVVLVDAALPSDAAGVARGTVTVVPVAFRDTRGAAQPGPRASDGCYVQVEGRSVRQLLRTLESVLERRRRGDVDACGTARTRAAT